MSAAKSNGLGSRAATERTSLLSASSPPSASGNGSTNSYGSLSPSPSPSTGTTTPTQHHLNDIPMPTWRVLFPVVITLWVPVFVASLDGTIVATLVGSISSDFHQSEKASWLGASYLLSVCCFTPIYGRLCDILGRRASMLLALLFFTSGTVLCGLSSSMGMLIASRALAGAGGGGLTTVTSTVMSDMVPLRNRGLLQGMTNIIFGLGSGLGGPVGGIMNDTIGWRKAFMVQVPFLCLSFLLSIVFIRVDAQRNASLPSVPLRSKLREIDYLGSLFLLGSVGPTLVSLSLMASDDVPFSHPSVWGGFLGGSISAILFIYVERHIALKPILPFRIIQQRTGAGVAVSNLALAMYSFATLYNFPLLLQATRLQSSSQAGFHLIPNSVALSVSSVLAGLWMRVTGRYFKYNLGHALLMVVSSVAIVSMTPKAPDWLTWIVLVPGGWGTSGVLTCTLIALINSVPRSDIAVATGISYLFRTTGQVVGVSVSGVILQSTLKRELRKRITGPGAEEVVSAIRHRSSLIPTLPPATREAAIAAYDAGLRNVFIFIGVCGLCVVLACSCMEDSQLPEAGGTKGGTAAAEEGEGEGEARDRREEGDHE